MILQKTTLISWLTIFILFSPILNHNSFAINRQSSNIKISQKTKLFQPTSFQFSNEIIQTNPLALLQAAKDTLNYFQSKNKTDRDLVKSAILENSIIPSYQAEKTLRFIIKIIETDNIKNIDRFRILNPKFLNNHFTFIRWFGDYKTAKKNKVFIPKWPDGGKLEKGKIKLTNYAAFRIYGSYFKTKKYKHALYSIVDKTFEKTTRFRYSKQDIINNKLPKHTFRKKIKPLVWLTRNGLEEALLQGTAIVIMPNNKQKIFNVSQSNGMLYDKTIKNNLYQKRYWYFKEVKDIHGTNGTPHLKILKHGGIAFAGDIKNIGLGKIIALRYQNPLTQIMEIRLGVLLDRGSAFSNNLYQLDLFAGIFNNRNQFKKKIRKLPNTVEAYLLIKK